MSKQSTYRHLTDDDLKAVFDQHTKKRRTRVKLWPGTHIQEINGFYTVTKEMHVFKKVYTSRGGALIANLIIPVGAIVYAERRCFIQFGYSDRKMRASEAYVHSIVRLYAKTPVTAAQSGWASSFIYATGTTVKPEQGFSRHPDQCDGGIHFFINFKDAQSY